MVGSVTTRHSSCQSTIPGCLRSSIRRSCGGTTGAISRTLRTKPSLRWPTRFNPFRLLQTPESPPRQPRGMLKSSLSTHASYRPDHLKSWTGYAMNSASRNRVVHWQTSAHSMLMHSHRRSVTLPQRSASWPPQKSPNSNVSTPKPLNPCGKPAGKFLPSKEPSLIWSTRRMGFFVAS
jgi:hypothetical protein